MWRGEFLCSDEGQRLVTRSRRHRRVYLSLGGIEPRSKAAMPLDQCCRFQDQVREQMVKLRRRPYRGPLVLRIGFVTTERNPSHIHTLAKNLLDLLGRTESGPYAGRALLYRDDQQVHGFAVRCEHGGNTPKIRIDARSLGDFREDLCIALSSGDAQDDENESDTLSDDLSHTSALDYCRREDFIRVFGEAAYQSEVVRYQQDAQRGQLRHNKLRVRDLAYFYRL